MDGGLSSSGSTRASTGLSTVPDMSQESKTKQHETKGSGWPRRSREKWSKAGQGQTSPRATSVWATIAECPSGAPAFSSVKRE